MPTSKPRDFYTAEAENYETVRYGSRYGRLFRLLQREVLTRALASGAHRKRILDVASGTGQALPSLVRAADLVVASDLTPAMLAEARRRCAQFQTVSYCVTDAEKLPYVDAAFDAVASSRFLHLFVPDRQQRLIAEMARVLMPGGMLVVDFYSASARRIFAPAIWPYRTLLQKRPENDYRVSRQTACRMLNAAGLHVKHVEGIGNFLLVPFLWLPQAWLKRAGTWLGQHCVDLSEQFVVVAVKP